MVPTKIGKKDLFSLMTMEFLHFMLFGGLIDNTGSLFWTQLYSRFDCILHHTDPHISTIFYLVAASLLFIFFMTYKVLTII